MTLPQLRSFATVARLGSVKAAARTLGVSEPAVSEAVASLRRELGDELYVRRGGGIALTPGGTRLAAAAAEILGLADDARRAVREARGESALLRVAATSEVHEHVAPALLDAFTRRSPHMEVAVQMEPGEVFARLLTDRLADVTLGPRPPGDAAGLESVPFLRYRLVVVAAPGHPLAGRRAIPAEALGREHWLVGPSGATPGTPAGDLLARRRLGGVEVRAFPSHAAAAAAAAAGRGVLPAIAHTVLDELRRRALVTLDVEGTPVDGLLYATLLAPARRPPAAWAFRRFVATPEATQAMLARPGGVPAARFRPPVYVTLWSG